ncbi:carbohydrate-binding module family 50 protein [Sporormia fimetaria CBS 119925]|uniref:Carbohydrate-binding module family 50 protein n=1 Tax=Sporormia fimetaria CBS 119925 TaxID=1340428 RepID=A0A6A6UU44_9PLEO|nr:carbohydrate-binding module family 50 protein [Sporormia fimetaria CBS 119925]
MMLVVTPCVVAGILLSSFASAFVKAPPNRLADAPEACIEALNTTYTCDSYIRRLSRQEYYHRLDLDIVCAASCKNALSSRRQPVANACGSYVYQESNGLWYSPVILVDRTLLTVDTVCRKSRTSRDYCNIWYASFNVTDANGLPTFFPPNGTNRCNDCYLSDITTDLKSPFGYSEELSSVHKSLTASCKSTTAYSYLKPTPVDITPSGSSSSPAPTAPTCSGVKYTVKLGDTCNSIATTNSITINELLVSNNNVFADCTSFAPVGTVLCIRKKSCKLYTVQEEDTCASIISNYASLGVSKFTQTQLISWNTNIRSGCGNLKELIGSTICVNNPGGDYKPSTTARVTPGPAPTPTAAPGNVADGVTDRCGQYYTITDRDNCAAVLMKNSITENDFRLLNPGVNSDCTNLEIGLAYCVRPVGSITSYISGTPISTSLVNFWDLPVAPSTVTWPDSMATQLPLANGTREDCVGYNSALPGNFTAEIPLTPCFAFASSHWAPWEAFLSWNPDAQSQVDTTGQCFIQPGVRYCTALGPSHEDPVRDEENNDPMTTVPADTVLDCAVYWTVMEGDSCAAILDRFELTIGQFFRMNPSVSSGCETMKLGLSYCVYYPGLA